MNTIINPGQFVVDIYNLALMFGGVLAFGAIVYGALSYSIAAGNPTAQHEAKEWITQALLGLLLLFGAYLILYTIDNDLPGNLAVPSLNDLRPIVSATTTVGCSNGGCVPITGISQVTCKPGSGCSADRRMVDKLKCIYNREPVPPSIEVTEAMPPTGDHDSGGHTNGCAIDVKVGSTVDCGKVQSFIQAANKCGGIGIYNEYPTCPNGHKSPKWTGPHIHMSVGC